MHRINCHRVQSDDNSTPDNISPTDVSLTWNGDLDNPNDQEEDYAADDESNIEHNHGSEDLECPEQQDVSAAPNVPGLVWPTCKSKWQAQKVIVTVNAVQTRRNNGGNNI
jgi:hypothetical protein